VKSITGGLALTNQGLYSQIYSWDLDIPGDPGIIKWDGRPAIQLPWVKLITGSLALINQGLLSQIKKYRLTIKSI
jgi:hypothetical protein